MKLSSLVFRKIAAKIVFGALWGHGRKRRRVAAAWLSGSGIEIGALHNPLPVPNTVCVTYLDRMNNAELLRQYPELSGKILVPVDLIDDGESLPTIADASRDFIVANHFLEHCENPIGALQTWLRVLKTGGIAYIAVPDKRFTFDFRRKTTDWEHVYQDYRIGPECSRKKHYMEWIKEVMAIGDGDADADAACAHIMRMCYSIHFHTWSAKSLNDFFISCRRVVELPFSICDFIRNGGEVIVILKKQPD